MPKQGSKGATTHHTPAHPNLMRGRSRKHGYRACGYAERAHTREALKAGIAERTSVVHGC